MKSDPDLLEALVRLDKRVNDPTESAEVLADQLMDANYLLVRIRLYEDIQEAWVSRVYDSLVAIKVKVTKQLQDVTIKQLMMQAALGKRPKGLGL